jgi:hypothetical protein
MCIKIPVAFLLCVSIGCAQDKADPADIMNRILQRLDALETENRQLVEEVRSLRQELEKQSSSSFNATTSNSSEKAKSTQETLKERITTNEHRIAEQAQTKVEASQKFPVQLTGMLLFNAFLNSGTRENPVSYGLLAGPDRSGATVRQTLIGFNFEGPHLPGNGRVNGSLMMDFWSGPSEPGDNWLRLRRANLSFDWANRSFSFGQDKPLISPHEPTSLAEVGVPPLAGAGNLWDWLPQAKYEERFRITRRTGITGQVALMQTDEEHSAVPTLYSRSLDRARPALEGRVAFWHRFDDTRRFEIAPGFHVSTTHVNGQSVDSRIGSLDWLIVPHARFQFTGTFYHGQNVSGLGSLDNGFGITSDGRVTPVHSSGGWAQASFPITSRLTWNLFGGMEDDRGSSLAAYSTVRGLSYASNLIYHLGPNVVVGLEALQLRTRSFSGDTDLHNSYDLAVGYLF